MRGPGRSPPSLSRQVKQFATGLPAPFTGTFTYTFIGTWYIGISDRSCTYSCVSYGYVCVYEDMWNKNEDVDSSAEVLRVLGGSGGGWTTATSCSGVYGTSADVPVFSSTQCWYSSPGRALDTISCSASPFHPQERRLCYCSRGVPKTVPTLKPIGFRTAVVVHMACSPMCSWLGSARPASLF